MKNLYLKKTLIFGVMQFTLLFGMLLANLYGSAQAPAKLCDKTIGGKSNESFVSLQQTSDGGYILGGSSVSGIGGDKTQGNKGGWDYWVVKLDASGTKTWDKTIGGTGRDVLTTMQQTSDEGYILGGYSWSGSGADKTQGSEGFFDYWVVKLDASGVKQWDKTFGGPEETSILNSLQQTSDGGYILGGYSFSGISGDKTQTSQGSIDFWIVKTDANGVKQWDKRFGCNKQDNLKSLEQNVYGGYILG